MDLLMALVWFYYGAMDYFNEKQEGIKDNEERELQGCIDYTLLCVNGMEAMFKVGVSVRYMKMYFMLDY